ncbi:hypothetical protein BJ741DRAFT_614419 [Chytriomyces cf. hyalinus JEL632]|nr:hypothetical protein BJ741DRAFT_614419 [Chytriomyces cf. hyalinus JEL632]
MKASKTRTLLWAWALTVLGLVSASLVAQHKSLLILPASDATRIQSVETASIPVGDKGLIALIAAGTVSGGQFLVFPLNAKGEADQYYGPEGPAETAGFIVRASNAKSATNILETEWIKVLFPENPKTDSIHVSGVVPIPKEGAVIVTGTFTGKSLTLQAKEDARELVRVLGGGASVRTAFVAKVSALGVFEWATSVQTLSLVRDSANAGAEAGISDLNNIKQTKAIVDEQKSDSSAQQGSSVAPNGSEKIAEADQKKNEKVQKRSIHPERRSDNDASKTEVDEHVNVQFPVHACLDGEIILVAGTYNGNLQTTVGNTASKGDVFDAFILKISAKTGDILANHANFVDFKSLKPLGMQSVFVVNSIEVDPCLANQGSIIVTGQSYSTFIYSKQGINHAFATAHVIRLSSPSSKDLKGTANAFETRETSTVALGRLKVKTESTGLTTTLSQHRVTRGMRFVALPESADSGEKSGKKDSCVYFVTGVMIKKDAMESSEKDLIAAAKADEAYTAFVAEMSNDFTFKENGARYDLPVFVDADELKVPSIAMGLYSILYVSGTVKNPKIPYATTEISDTLIRHLMHLSFVLNRYQALSGISLSGTAPHNYLLGIEPYGRRITSKTAIPQPSDLELLHGTHMTLGDTVQLQSSSGPADELFAHGILGSHDVLDRGMWLGVLDLTGVTAYSESMAPKKEKTGGEKSGTQAKEGADDAVVPSAEVGAPPPVPIPAEPKLSPIAPSPIEQKKVEEVPKAALTNDSKRPGGFQPPETSETGEKMKPPVVVEKPVQNAEKPVVPPVNDEDEPEEGYKPPTEANPEDLAAQYKNEDDKLKQHVQTAIEDSFFTGAGFLFVFILVVIVAAVLFIAYKVRRENLGHVIDMKNLPASLHKLFNTMFDPRSQGTNRGAYAPAASKQEDDSELQELPHPVVTPGRSILSAAPLTHRKSSVVDGYGNAPETSVPINFSGNSSGVVRGVSPTMLGGTAKITMRQSEEVEPLKDESWGWDEGDMFDDGSESKSAKKEDDEWGW